MILVVGCRSQAPLPPRPAQVDVSAYDYGFSVRGAIPPGRVVFSVHNDGRAQHELVMVPLPKDFHFHPNPKATSNTGLSTLAILARRQPGQSGTFAVDLAPGRYGFVCFVTDPDGVQHYFKGMTFEFEVR